MKRIILALLFCVGMLAAEAVNGDTLRVQGFKVLKVWGNHSQRGYASGYLTGQSMMDLFNNYVMPTLYSNSSAIYGYARGFYGSNFSNDQVLKTEAGAVIRGAKAAGVNINNSILNRDLDSLDILMINSVPDLSALGKNGPSSAPGCADLLSWGAATHCSVGAGTLVTRHLDWDNNIYLKRNHLIYVHYPAENDEQVWAGFGFAGLMGALSGVNQANTVTFQNQGNNGQTPVGGSYYPINLAQRRGIELKDVDGDGVSTHKDVYSFIRSKSKSYSYIVTAVSERVDGVPYVLECRNNKVDSARTKDNNGNNFSDNLIVTNHHRVLFAPVSCYRYANITDSLLKSTIMTLDRSWSILAGGAGHAGTLQTIQFIPSQAKLRLAFSIPNGLSSYMQEPKEILLADLLAPVGITEERNLPRQVISAYPNPFNPSTTIAFESSAGGTYKLAIYDISGRIVESQNIAAGEGRQLFTWQAGGLTSGIYYAVVKDQQGKSVGVTRLVLLK